MAHYEFHDKLFNLINKSIKNYHGDNFDEETFGLRNKNFIVDLRKRLSSFLFPNHINKNHFVNVLKGTSILLEEYGHRLEQVYQFLANDESKDWFVRMIVYKLLGHEKVKLPTNTPLYFSIQDSQKKYLNYEQYVDVFYLGKKKKLYLSDLSKLGLNIKVFSAAVDHIFIHQQHKYKDIVMPEMGDVVLDCGACYGDSCLYFANLVGENGKVYSFEFIPGNLEVFRKNLKLNTPLNSLAELIEAPLWDKNGLKVYFKDNGPASRVEYSAFDGYEGITETQTLDNFYQERELQKVDFIKMDIEGAELYALKGGEKTIRKHKPKLAIAAYHSMDDFVNIPIWINNLELGYKIYIDHSTIHWGETIVFAIAS